MLHTTKPNQTRYRVLLSLLTLVVLSLGFVFAQYNSKSATVTISGTSSLHDWTSKVNTVTMTGDFVIEDGNLTEIKSAKVEIPVRSIKSGKGSTMDNNTYNALKARSHSKITFTLTNVRSINKSGNNINISVNGNLSIAGTTKATTLSVRGKVLSNGDIEFSGSKRIDMTDYGVEPPTALLGTIKTGKDVTINFKVKLGK